MVVLLLVVGLGLVLRQRWFFRLMVRLLLVVGLVLVLKRRRRRRRPKAAAEEEEEEEEVEADDAKAEAPNRRPPWRSIPFKRGAWVYPVRRACRG